MGFKSKIDLKTGNLGYLLSDLIDSTYTGVVFAPDASGDVAADTVAFHASATKAIELNAVLYLSGGTRTLNTLAQSVPAGYSGTVTNAAFYATGTDKKLVMRGESWKTTTIKTQAGDSGGWLLFLEDIAVFDTDQISFESSDTATGKNGPIYCAGVNEVHLGKQRYSGFGNNLTCGASFTRVPQLLTFDYQEFDDMYNDLCFTTKPGGCKQVYGGTVVMRNCRGGMSIEGEDNQGFGLPDHVVEYCQIDKIIGYDLDATKGGQAANVIFVVKFEDGVERAQIGQVIGENVTNSVADLGGVVAINSGQTDTVPEIVQIGQIIADNVENAVILGMETSVSKSIDIGSIQCGKVGSILRCRPFTGTPVTGGFKRVRVGSAAAEIVERPAEVSGVAIAVFNGDDSVVSVNASNVIDNLIIGSLSYDNAENNGFGVRNVGKIYVGEHIGATHDSFASGGKFYNVASNYIEADEIYIGKINVESAGRQGYAISPKVRAEIGGGRIKDTLSAGLRLNGSGKQIVGSLQVTDEQTVQTQDTGINFDTASDTFDGTDVNTSTEQITMSSHPFRHNELVVYTEDGSGTIGGLTDGDEIYIIYVDTNTVQLSATKSGSAINFTSASGTGHGLQKKNEVQLFDLDLEGNKTQAVGGFGNAFSLSSRNTQGWMEGSFTYDPPSIAASGQTTTTFTLNDSRVGDRVLIYPPYDLQQLIHSAYVSANNTVELQLFNPTVGAIDLASGSWRVRVEKDNR